MDHPPFPQSKLRGDQRPAMHGRSSSRRCVRDFASSPCMRTVLIGVEPPTSCIARAAAFSLLGPSSFHGMKCIPSPGPYRAHSRSLSSLQAFTAWVNSQLRVRQLSVKDIETDLSDGRMLCQVRGCPLTTTSSRRVVSNANSLPDSFFLPFLSSSFAGGVPSPSQRHRALAFTQCTTHKEQSHTDTAGAINTHTHARARTHTHTHTAHGDHRR
jgi:hypothetical protein